MLRKEVFLVLVALSGVCYARGPYFSFFDFHPLSRARCLAQNPFAGYPGQPFSIPEDPPIIPPQPGERGSVYLPVASEFPSPIRGPLPDYITNYLIDVLGDDLDFRLLSIGEEQPIRDSIVPGTVRPANVPISSGAIPGGVGTTVAPPRSYREEIIAILQMAANDVLLPDANIPIVADIAVALTERCEVMSRWQKLPDGQYFPQWVSAGFCSGDNCSLPAGLHCNPVLTEETLIPIPVLRWDCCWGIDNLQWRWECGWRKVLIQLIGQCSCACFDDIGGLYSHTGRVGGNPRPHIPGLNT